MKTKTAPKGTTTKKAAPKATAARKTGYSQLELSHVPLPTVINGKDMTYRKLDKEWAKELSLAIENNGMDVPMILWRGETPKKVKFLGELRPATYLVAGLHRREALKLFQKRAAAKFAKMFPEGVPVLIREGSLQSMLCTQLRENVDRKDMPSAEVFPVIDRLEKEFGLNQKAIAKEIGKSASWVSDVLVIKKELGDEAVDAVQKGKSSLKDMKDAAHDTRKAKKAGMKTDPKKAVAGAEKKTAARVATGAKRNPKSIGAKTVLKRYKALPSMSANKKLPVIEAALLFLAGERKTLPKELQLETDK